LNLALIFDFDGVVINSVDLQRKAFFESYRQVGGTNSLSFEEFLSHSGDSLPNIFTKMGLPLAMIKPYREISNRHIDRIKIFPGIGSLLTSLKREGHRCGICTGKDRERTLSILKRFDLHCHFDTLVCSDDVRNPKPHPESLLLALRKLKATTARAAMIGDAVNDILCARNAGVQSIGVTWGDAPRQALENANPDFLVEDIDELQSIIHSLA
jgi:3-amino-5-hydroxybenzoic acid synthesis related protein